MCVSCGQISNVTLTVICTQVIDNSGALLIECVNVLKQKVNNGWGSVGDEIVCVVKRARPISGQQSASVTKVRQGDVRRAVIVRTRKAVRRPDGRFIRFDDNAAVLLNNKREMLGTRIAGVVSADLRMKGWGKIVSLAPKVRRRVLDPRCQNASYSRIRRFCRRYIIHACNAMYPISLVLDLRSCFVSRGCHTHTPSSVHRVCGR